MARRFQYYVPFTNHTQYRARARARAREYNNTMEKFILNFTHLFLSMSTSYVRMHIYIEDIYAHEEGAVCVDSVGIRILYIAQGQLVAFGASK